MPLVELEFRNIRLYELGQLAPDPRLTLITGANASGKTTLLEAVHLLSSGRSFRTSQLDQIRRHGATNLSVSGKYQPPGQEIVRLGLAHSELGRRAVVNGIEQGRLSALTQYLPLLVISPDSHYEFLQSARCRRSAMDWLLFHVEQDYSQLWGRYQRALEQRNAALKDRKQAKTRFAWDEELTQLGLTIQNRRDVLMESLRPLFLESVAAVLDTTMPIELRLDAGWDVERGLADCLLNDRGRDEARGYTHSGPHRNDLSITLGGKPFQKSASHGQNKLLVVALRLAQVRLLFAMTGRECCLLIDDLPAELDRNHRARLAEVLPRLPIQVFVTATDADQIPTAGWSSHRKFHVEHGRIYPH
jgi:DNA replication and repair protein RecF